MCCYGEDGGDGDGDAGGSLRIVVAVVVLQKFWEDGGGGEGPIVL